MPESITDPLSIDVLTSCALIARLDPSNRFEGLEPLDILTSCDLISEGLDVPSVGAVILLRPTASLILCLQQIGRGMRPKADGSPLIVLDHAGNTLRHGLPEEDRDWSLDGVTKDTRGPANVIADDGELRPGKKRQIEEVDGELIEAQRADALARYARMSYGQFRKTRRTDQQIAAYAKAHNYKPGWCHYFRREQTERFGGIAA